MATELPEILVTPDPQQEPEAPKVSLAAPAVEKPTVSLAAPTEQSIWPSPELAANRTNKALFGSGPLLNMPKNDVYQNIVSGSEDGLRRSLASSMDMNKGMARQQRLMDAAKGGSLSMEQVNAIMSDAEPTDPRSVIEDNYARKHVDALKTAATTIQDTFYNDARKEIPDHVDAIERGASEVLAKREFAITQAQNMRETVKAQGWLPWGADQAKNLFQPYVEAKLRGNVEGVGAVGGGLLLGNNLKEQADALMSLPYKEYKDKLSTVVTNLAKDNPSLAEQFATYIAGTTTSDRFLNNTFTAIAVPDYYAGVKGAAALARQVNLYNRTTKAAKDIVKAAKATDNLPAAAAEGAGDVGEAAVQNQAKFLTESGDPTKESAETLLSSMRTDPDSWDSNAGNLTREQLTNLKDGYLSRTKVVEDAVQTALKVTRTPVPLAVESALREIKESIRDSFRGIKDSIIDIANPRHDNTTNTYWHDVYIGNHGGELFSNPQTARNFAKLYGMADADIVDNGATGPFKFYVPESAIRTVGGGANPNFGVKIVDGTPTFYSDIANGIKVDHTTVPSGKMVPVSLEPSATEASGFKPVFGRPLTNESAAIEQQGLGYYIRVTKPLNETDGSVRKFLLASKDAISSAGTKDVHDWKNAAIGWLRGADDTLAFNDSVQRKVATYAVSGLKKAGSDIGKYIEQIYTGVIKSDPVTGETIPWVKAKAYSIQGKLSQKQTVQQFEQALDYARSAVDPATGKKGYFFKNPGELDDFYQRTFQRSPSYAETEAYFAAVQYNEYDRVLRNIAEFRNRARVGAEQHSVRVVGPDGTMKNSDFFDGVTKKVFPGGEGNILVMGTRQGEEKLYSLGNISQKTLEDFREGVKTGEYKVIEIYNPAENPLSSLSREFGDTSPRYVLTRNVDSKKLSYDQVERRGGGHFEYDYEHYIKQAKVKATAFINANDKRVVQHTYTGDTTVMPIELRSMGQEVAGHLNKVRELIKAKDFEAAKAYTQAHLPIEWSELRGWFSPKRDPDGTLLPPRLDVNEPFQVVPRNGSIYGMDKDLENRYPKTFVDNSKKGSLNQQYQVGYNVERTEEDIKTITPTGSKENPLYAYEPAKMVDPLPTMNRALNRSINSTFMDDYKMYAVEHWLSEAAPYLKEEMSSIRNAPFWNFTTITKNSFKPDAPTDKVWNLMSNRDKIQQFIGVPDKIDTWIHGLTQKLADDFYDSYGPEGSRNVLEKGMSVVPLKALAYVKDPISFMRSVTFNAKLGHFAIPQLLVQMQTFSTIASITPKASISGSFATLLHTWARFSGEEAILAKLDNYATKLGIGDMKWKSGEWLEARREMAKAGFEHVGGEYAMADDIFKHKFIGNTWQNFLSAGQVPFKEGERASRIGAYYTAFKEFREANPTGALTNADRQAILQRADLLTVNMSRASSSVMHGGIWSLPTQFLSYQLRLAELFFGKRMGETTMERTMARARMIGIYSALYGVPTAFGLTGLPLGDAIRESAMDNGKIMGVQVQPGGYVVGDNQIRSLIMEGIPAWTMAMVSGWGDARKGNWYNYGDRYGAQGFTQIRDALKSDSPWWRLIGGAATSTFVNTFTSLDPFMMKAVSLARGDDPKFNITIDHMLDAFKEVSSVNSARKFIAAMNTGRWMSTNGAFISEISKTDAAFRTITGMTAQQQQDMMRRADIRKEEEAMQKDYLKKFINEWRRGIMAQDTNPDQADKYFQNAMAYLYISGYPVEKRLSAIAIANKGYESQIKTSLESFGTRNVPMNKRDARIEQWRRELQLNNERNQP